MLRFLIVLWLAAATSPLLAQPPDATVRFGPRERLGRILSDEIDESSGLTPSWRHPGKYWTHNDNGSRPGLFLIDLAGKHLATAQLRGAPFRDWEAMSGLRVDGQPYLVVADVGDNQSRYPAGRIYVIREPEFELPPPGTEAAVPLVIREFATIEFTYPGGPHDCEAVAVDAAGDKIFLISKRMTETGSGSPTLLHWIPWRTESTQKPLVATRLESGFREPMVTGMDIAPNNELAVIRTYATAWIYRREGRTWEQAFAGQPDARTLLPLQRQGEAICFTRDAAGLIITSEGSRQSIWRIAVSKVADDR